MTKPDETHEKLMRDLAALKLSRIAEIYREVLDRAARKNSSTLEVLSTLIAEEAIARSERALERRIRQARLPKRKTLEEYDFTFPKRMPKQKILRLFDCQFIEQHLCGIFIGLSIAAGNGASFAVSGGRVRGCVMGRGAEPAAVWRRLRSSKKWGAMVGEDRRCGRDRRRPGGGAGGGRRPKGREGCRGSCRRSSGRSGG